MRVSKSKPKPDFQLMSPANWQEFDRRLEERLRQLPQSVEISEGAMGAHYDRMTNCVRATVEEVVPPRKKFKYNGREVSAETRRLCDLRVRDFASGREIKKSDRDAWNRTLNKAAKKDFDLWVEKRVQDIEQADEKGDSRAMSEGAHIYGSRKESKM